MTCHEFCHLTRDDNGRDINNYTTAELVAMVRHFHNCAACRTRAFFEAACIEATRPDAEKQKCERDATVAFDRITQALPIDREL